MDSRSARWTDSNNEKGSVSQINGWRTFLLTTPSNSVKAAVTIQHLVDSGILQVEIFHGMDASVSGLDHTQWTYEIDHPGSDYRINAKHINMVLSYLMLWKVMSYQSDDAFVVLEDDVRFDPDWRLHFDEAMTHLPDDWDLLYIGNCCSDGRMENNRTVWGRLARVGHILCTHAIAIRKKALPILIEGCSKIFSPIDLAISLNCADRLNCYAILPRIAHQHETFLSP